MKRYLLNAIIYCVLGIILLIIGIIWKGLGPQAYLTGISMLSCGVCFELVAIYFFIRHKREEKE